MTSIQHTRSTMHGFTLIETMVAVAVMTISMTIAVPSYQQFIASQSIRTTSMDVVSSLILARSEAVKRNGNVALVPISNDWKNGWQVVHVGSGTEVGHAEPMNGKVALQGAQPAMVQFNADGRVVGAAATQKLDLAVTNGASTMHRCIELDPAGLPRVKKAACT